jgi:hypothetical protein
MYTKFRSINHKERDNLGHTGVDRRIIVKWILDEMGCADVVWTHRAEDRVGCRTLVNTAVNRWVQEWLCSVALVS